MVKQNAAIYDVNHPHYRRTPVRVAIWDNIAKELGAPCKLTKQFVVICLYCVAMFKGCLGVCIASIVVSLKKFFFSC